MKEETGRFLSPTIGELSLDEVIDEIVRFMDEDANRHYRLVIGTDSQNKRINGVSEIDFVTAIVIHKIGKGGRYFWTREREIKKYVLQEKIFTETAKSLELAEKLVPVIRNRVSAGKYDLEIHVDVGSVGPTRTMIREVVGMVTGNGYTVKTKPDSYGASTIADRHT